MLYSRASIFSEMAQACPTKHSLSRGVTKELWCNYDPYDLVTLGLAGYWIGQLIF